MTPTNLIGIAISTLLITGFGWALIDLGARIVKQRKQPFDLLKLSSYPLVPDEPAGEHPGHPHRDGLKLRPVPIEVERR